MGENVSFKVFLKGTEEEEVRRFVVDKAVSASYEYLVGKLGAMFPQMRAGSFSLTWADSDGDKVTITNDEELLIALTEMPGPLYKLNLALKEARKAAVPAATAEAEETEAKAVHYGVTCDGCEVCPITGTRYKSLELDDYDLCEVCEAKGVHPGQNMIKITEPGYTFPQRLFKRMQVLQERAKNKEETRAKKCEEKEEKKEARRTENAEAKGLFGSPVPGQGSFRGCGFRGRGGRGGRGGLFGPFGHLQGGAWAAAAAPAWADAMMKGWTGAGEGWGLHAEQHAKAVKEAMRAHDAGQKATAATAAAAGATAEDASAAGATAEAAAAASSEALNSAFEDMGMTGSEDYLKNVGSFVAAALDPLGIDVKIDIETPEGRKSCHVSRQSSTATTLTTKEATAEATAAVAEDKKEEPREFSGILR